MSRGGRSRGTIQGFPRSDAPALSTCTQGHRGHCVESHGIPADHTGRYGEPMPWHCVDSRCSPFTDRGRSSKGPPVIVSPCLRVIVTQGAPALDYGPAQRIVSQARHGTYLPDTCSPWNVCSTCPGTYVPHYPVTRNGRSRGAVSQLPCAPVPLPWVT